MKKTASTLIIQHTVNELPDGQLFQILNRCWIEGEFKVDVYILQVNWSSSFEEYTYHRYTRLDIL